MPKLEWCYEIIMDDNQSLLESRFDSLTNMAHAIDFWNNGSCTIFSATNLVSAGAAVSSQSLSRHDTAREATSRVIGVAQKGVLGADELSTDSRRARPDTPLTK